MQDIALGWLPFGFLQSRCVDETGAQWQKTLHKYTVSQKNDTGVAHYNFDADQPISIIFGKGVAERARYQMVLCYPTSHNYCLCTTWGNMNPGNCVFSVMLHTVSRKRNG